MIMFLDEVDNLRSERLNIQQKKITQIFSESFFLVSCILVFACAAFHWRFDIAYKYIVGTNSDIIDYRLCATIAAILILFFVIKNKKVPFDAELIILLSTLLYVGYLDYQFGRNADICYWYILFSAYLLGRVVIGTKTDVDAKRLIAMFLSLVVGMFVASFLDFSINFRTGWAYGTETWPNFFSGDLERRTTYEFGFVLTTSLLGYAVFTYKKNKIISCLIIIINIFIQYCVINVEGRENTFMALISIFIVLILYVNDLYVGLSDKAKRTIKIIGFGMTCLIVVSVLLWNLNFFGVKDLYLHSYLNSSGGVIHNIRFKYDYDGFMAMLKYPFDDYEPILHIKRPHSTILEYGRVYNIIVYAGLLVFRICVIMDTILFAKKCKNENRYLKYLVVPAFVNLNIYYSLEPNGYAHRHFLMAGLLLSGMIKAYIEHYSF